MNEIDNQFKSASEQVNHLSTRPNNDELLKLYSLYKQATVGDVQGKRPGILDVKGRKKYDAWSAIKGTTCEHSKQKYIHLVQELKQNHG